MVSNDELKSKNKPNFNSQGIRIDVGIIFLNQYALIWALFFKDVLFPQAVRLNNLRLPSPNFNDPSGEGTTACYWGKNTKKLFKTGEQAKGIKTYE